MDRISFDIFIPDGKKFHLTSNWLMFILWLITIIPLCLLSNNELDSIKSILIIWVIAVGGITIFLMVSSYFTYMPLFGKLSGDLVLAKDCIIVDHKIFKLTEINIVDFVFDDFYGKKSTAYHSYNPKYSQGVDNHITFIDKLNQTQTIYFKMFGEHSYMSICDFINDAVRLEVISDSQALKFIGDKNVI